MYRHILVVLDGSRFAERALEQHDRAAELEMREMRCCSPVGEKQRQGASRAVGPPHSVGPVLEYPEARDHTCYLLPKPTDHKHDLWL